MYYIQPYDENNNINNNNSISIRLYHNINIHFDHVVLFDRRIRRRSRGRRRRPSSSVCTPRYNIIAVNTIARIVNSARGEDPRKSGE